MTPKKIKVRCTNIVIAEVSSVQFTTELKPQHKAPTPNPVNTLFAIQFDNHKEAKEFDRDEVYEITIAKSGK